MKKNSISSVIFIACAISFLVVLLKIVPSVNNLPSDQSLAICLALALVLLVLPALVLANPEKYWRLLKRAWAAPGILRAAWAWRRENVRGFGESILFCRVTLWASMLVPYYYKHRSMPGFLKAITPGQWPFRELTPEVERKMALVNSYAVGTLNQYENQRTHMCFRRSLVLYHFLRAEGVPARWFLGVRSFEKNEARPPGFTPSDRYIGHAWVEINGRHYMDEMDGHRVYKISFSYPDEEKYAAELRIVHPPKLEDLKLPILTDLGGDGDAWFE